MDYLRKTLDLPNLDDIITKNLEVRKLKKTGKFNSPKELNIQQKKNENITVENEGKISESITTAKRTVNVNASSGNSLDYNKLLEQLSRLEIDLLYTVYRNDFDTFSY